MKNSLVVLAALTALISTHAFARTAALTIETETAFREELQFFQPQPIEGKTFSDDLVPVAFDDPKPQAVTHHFMTTTRYAWYSDGKTPFNLTITPGTISWNRNGKPWAVGGPSFSISLLYFYNVPNVIAATPSDLMVPREVAKKDGLTMVGK